MIGGAETFGFFARKLEQERALADAIVQTIEIDLERHLDIPMPPAWLTLGMVDRLCDAARTELMRSPRKSRSLAQLAVAIAEGLSDSYPRIMRAQFAAHAWKTLSNAYRIASRYEASVAALDEADRRIADEPVLAYDRAVLALARGVVLSEMGRWDDALHLLDAAQETFAEYQDARQVAQCDLAVGMTLHSLGRIAEARQAYMRVIKPARAAGDLHTAAAAYNNLGRAASDAGNLSAAVDALQQARAIFRELDMPAEIARTSWSIGVAELTASHFESAIPILRAVRQELLKLGMPEEAGLAGVDLIEALLATDHRSAARELAVVIADEFRAADLNERALQALSYLREMADAATPAVAHHVGSYLRRLKEQPALLFAPPAIQR
ncbi:MAG TPA: tetratricopeptide repeat protein [Thermoanaerobaculia bacterium]|nr:tetratricopeptide repeat protein [Thermoanaerobaculia bacterium]